MMTYSDQGTSARRPPRRASSRRVRTRIVAGERVGGEMRMRACRRRERHRDVKRKQPLAKVICVARPGAKDVAQRPLQEQQQDHRQQQPSAAGQDGGDKAIKTANQARHDGMWTRCSPERMIGQLGGGVRLPALRGAGEPARLLGGAEQGLRLVDALLLLGFRIGISHDPGTSLHVHHAILHSAVRSTMQVSISPVAEK